MSESRDLTLVSDAARMLAEAETLDEIRQVLNLAEAARHYAKKAQLGLDAQNRAAAISLEAQAKAAAALESARQSGEMADQGGDRKSKSSASTLTLSDVGVSRDEAAAWSRVAAVPTEVIREYVAVAADAGDEVTRAGLLRHVSGQHVGMGGLKASGIVEWYTPDRYVESARSVMGGIDLDPASSVVANRTVRADRIYTVEDDGLQQQWRGRVWLNPPYGKGSGLFTTKLVEEYRYGNVTAAVLLLNAYGFDSSWFRPLWDHPICFTDHRVQFYSPMRESGGPANGNIFVYLGEHDHAFAEEFLQYGQVVRAWPDYV